MTFGLRYMDKMLFRFKFLEKWCMGSCNFPAGINEITLTRSTRHDFLKKKNFTIQNAKSLTLIFLK